MGSQGGLSKVSVVHLGPLAPSSQGWASMHTQMVPWKKIRVGPYPWVIAVDARAER